MAAEQGQPGVGLNLFDRETLAQQLASEDDRIAQHQDRSLVRLTVPVIMNLPSHSIWYARPWPSALTWINALETAPVSWRAALFASREARERPCTQSAAPRAGNHRRFRAIIGFRIRGDAAASSN